MASIFQTSWSPGKTISLQHQRRQYMGPQDEPREISQRPQATFLKCPLSHYLQLRFLAYHPRRYPTRLTVGLGVGSTEAPECRCRRLETPNEEEESASIAKRNIQYRLARISPCKEIRQICPGNIRRDATTNILPARIINKDLQL